MGDARWATLKRAPMVDNDAIWTRRLAEESEEREPSPGVAVDEHAFTANVLQPHSVKGRRKACVDKVERSEALVLNGNRHNH